MKIRKGFVSNSSSSSFVIKNGMTTAQIATIMLYGVKQGWLQDQDYAYNNETYSSFRRGMDDAIQWLESNQEFNEPIVFPWTTNYETFIWHNEELGTCVDTCNNESEYWGILGPNYNARYDDECFDQREDVKFFDLDSRQYFTSREYQDKRWEDITGKKR